MKKVFESPEINIEEFLVQDVITTSDFTPGENETPIT